MMKKEKDRKKGKETQKESGRDVEFSFHAPEVTEVFLAAEFNGWDTSSLLMKQDRDGVWKTTVKLLPGRYEYKFYADNVWVEDLPAAELVSNPFGTKNFVIWVSER